MKQYEEYKKFRTQGKVGAKEQALAVKSSSQILGAEDLWTYFILDDHLEFITLIKNLKGSKNFYEHIPDDVPVNMFYDIDAKECEQPKIVSDAFHDPIGVAKKIIDKNRSFFGNLGYASRFIVLEAHGKTEKNENKISFHIIVKLTDNKDRNVYVENVHVARQVATHLFPDWTDCTPGVVDTNVYKDGLFRTVGSSKRNEDRPLMKSNELTDKYRNFETFASYCYQAASSTLLSISDLKIEKGQKSQVVKSKKNKISKDINPSGVIAKFIKDQFDSVINPTKIREEVNNGNKTFSCNIEDDKFCFFANRTHSSNRQYITISKTFAARKCHDTDCKGQSHAKIKSDNYSDELKQLFGVVIEQKEHDAAIDLAKKECAVLVYNAWKDNVMNFEFDHGTKVYFAKAGSEMNKYFSNPKCMNNCKIDHIVNFKGLQMKCRTCKSEFPWTPMIIPQHESLKTLNAIFNVTINTNTINNYNNKHGNDPGFYCEVDIDPTIFNDDSLTELINQILDGPKPLKVSELLFREEKDFVFWANETPKREMWYYFDGKVWSVDCGEFYLRNKITETLGVIFDTVRRHYKDLPKSEETSALLQHITRQSTNLYRLSSEEEIIKLARRFYINRKFPDLLDCKKTLLPFTNGVFDLEKREFRPCQKEDYISKTVGYDYNASVMESGILLFLEQILPDQEIREYVLKRFADCLNAEIPNTTFLMFTGSGSNGKSQLFNLMEAAMGDFAGKYEVTLLTRKRNNPNETNSEKVDLKGKRFGFFSEPEDDEKINISFLKELTGSETVKATAKYESAGSFLVDAKLFLGCNDLPEVKATDKAVWRRVRVVDFPSEFVDEPTLQHQFKKDLTIPTRIRSDIAWRQTLMNILLDVYYKDVATPNKVQVRTDTFKDENNEMEMWCQDHLVFDPNSHLKLEILSERYFGSFTAGKAGKGNTKLKNAVIEFMKKNFVEWNDFEYKKRKIDNVPINCFKGINFL